MFFLHRYIHCAIGVSVTLIYSAFACADDSSFAKCLETKDAKKRLVCYDTVAPSIAKQLNELSEAKAAALMKQNAEAEATQKEQQKLVRDTLRELRKLSIATEVGISKTEYSRRVVDVASAVQLSLPEIGNVAVRGKIKEALTAYTDANELWNNMFRAEYVSAFFKYFGKDAAKYGITASVYSDYNGTFARQGMDRVLSPVWEFGKQAIDDAEKLATKRDGD